MNTFNILNKNDSVENIMHSMFKSGIKRTYDEGKDRVILFPARKIKTLSGTSPFVAECNGIIFNVATRMPLCVPIPAITTIIDINAVNNSLDKYDIYKALDGTTINIYEWGNGDNKWRISTTKGYDVSNMYWSSHTYREMLNTILTNLGFNVDEFYGALCSGNSYTFVIKHPDIHQYWEGGEPIYDIHFIQSVNLTTFERKTEWKEFQGIKYQEKYSCSSIKELFPLLTNAINNIQNEHLYGFIIRSKDFKYNALLESSLLKTIRNFIYNERHIKKAVELDIPCDAYTFLISVLNFTKRERFLELFPQFTRSYGTVKTRAMELAELVERKYKSSLNNSDSEGTDGDMVNFIFNKLNEETSYRENMTNFIYNYILHPSNIMLVYTMISQGIS